MNLQDELDIALTKVFEELRVKHEASVGKPFFLGQVAGFLLKSAIKLAKEGGCPYHVLRESLLDSVNEEYGK